MGYVEINGKVIGDKMEAQAANEQLAESVSELSSLLAQLTANNIGQIDIEKFRAASLLADQLRGTPVAGIFTGNHHYTDGGINGYYQTEQPKSSPGNRFIGTIAGLRYIPTDRAKGSIMVGLAPVGSSTNSRHVTDFYRSLTSYTDDPRLRQPFGERSNIDQTLWLPVGDLTTVDGNWKGIDIDRGFLDQGLTTHEKFSQFVSAGRLAVQSSIK